MLHTERPYHIIAIVFLTLLVAILAAVNFRAGSWLLGWDALSPEFNIGANAERSLFAAWQGNEGVGLLGGHGYAATLPHTLAIRLLMFLVPVHAVRYAFTMLMLLAGVLGTYYLAMRLTNRVSASVLAALFYLTNFGTVQIFSLQLEAFVVHYAALPWIIITLLESLEYPSPATFLIHFAIWALAMTQGFIPPLFIVAYLLELAVVGGYLMKRKRVRKRTALLVLAIPLAANLFWLPTFLYYAATQPGTVLAAFNTLWSTPLFTGQSVKYGTLPEIALLRGLYYDSVATIVNDMPVFVFEPWKRFFAIPGTVLIGYLWFAVAAAGVAVSFVKRKPAVVRALAVIFLIMFAGLAKGIPGFRELNAVIDRIPLLNQAFRTPFTKLVIALAFTASLMIALAARELVERVPLRRLYTVTGIACVSLMLFALPAFTGNLFYRSLNVRLPAAYTNLMSFFAARDRSERILVLPQDCAEGWTSYAWGYAGSGFLQYGLRQPIMDRAFDVWSGTDENSYWELTQILKSRNYPALERYLAKYNVAWIVYDPNIGHCTGARGFQHLLDLPDYLIKSGFAVPTKSFPSPGIQTIGLYRVRDAAGPVTVYNDVPNIAPQYDWIDDDTAFTQHGPYITDSRTQPDVYYPFRSLFSKRGQPDGNTILSQDDASVSVSTVIRSSMPGAVITIPPLVSTESLVPAQLAISTVSGAVDLRLLLPSFSTDNAVLWKQTPQAALTSGIAGLSRITVGDRILSINSTPKETASDPFFVSLSNPTVLTLTGKNGQQTVTIEPGTALDLASLIPDHLLLPDRATRFTVTVPKISIPQVSGRLGDERNLVPVACPEGDPEQPSGTSVAQNGSVYRWTTTRGSQCMIFPADAQPLATGYFLTLPYGSQSGVPASVRLTNTANKTPDMEYRMAYGAAVNGLVPVMYPYGEGRTVTVKQTAIGQPSVSDIGLPSMYPIPYRMIKQVTIARDRPARQTSSMPCTAQRLSETAAVASCPSGSELMFAESFDDGWQAFAVSRPVSTISATALHLSVPFIAKPLGGHVRWSGWANAWSLPGGSTQIVILYMPQLLQLAGIALSLVSLAGILLAAKR